MIVTRAKISPEAAHAKSLLVKEQVDASRTREEERRDWDAYGETLPISPFADSIPVEFAGVECLRLTPVSGTRKSIVIYVHGGGFTTGSILTHRSMASVLAATTASEVIVPEYRLLPENPIEAAIEDILCVLAGVREETNSGIPILLGGDSSGAALAMTAANIGCKRVSNAVRGCFAISGAFDASLSSPSHSEKADADPILSKPVLEHWQSQLGKDTNLFDPQLSPIYADLSFMPPTLLLVGEDEVWFDDSKRMHEKLVSSEIACSMTVYPGMWHVWPMTTELPESQQAFNKIADFIEQL